MNTLPRAATVGLLLALAAIAGCQIGQPQTAAVRTLPPVNAPRELNKVLLPDYVIEPPDILLIDAVSIVPRGPHRIMAQDILMIQVIPSFPEQPIAGPYVVDGGGAVNFGPAYGSVQVGGMTLQEAVKRIEVQLGRIVKEPLVYVSLIQSAARQQIQGEHLVGPDGTVNLGTYGRVLVTGLTVEQARMQIQSHLNQSLEDPEIAVDVAGYNSKVYYVVTEGAGFGDGLNRFPVTGNETVLDAIAQVNGLSQVSSKRVWIARPAPDHVGCDQILPVDWVAVTKGGSTTTNYQILPGDRVFIAEDHLVSFDRSVNKLLSPFERMLGFTFLGSQTVRSLNGENLNNF